MWKEPHETNEGFQAKPLEFDLVGLSHETADWGMQLTSQCHDCDLYSNWVANFENSFVRWVAMGNQIQSLHFYTTLLV